MLRSYVLDIKKNWQLKNYKRDEMHSLDNEKIKKKTLARWRNIIPRSEALISVLMTPLVVPLRQ